MRLARATSPPASRALPVIPATMNKDSAQRRADQIAAFRAELAELSREGAPALDPVQVAAVAAHHDALLATLALQFDVDRSPASRRMTRGMQVASALGAAALVAAVVSFFFRVWGSLSTAAQVALLVAAPVVALALMLVAGRIERTRYVASLCAIVACGAFVLETVALQRMFNLSESPLMIAAWALFAGAVSTPWRFRIPFALAVGAAACSAGAAMLEIVGSPWTEVLSHPEPVVAVAGIMLLAIARMPRELAPVGRGVLLVLLLLPLLMLSAVDGLSLLPFDAGVVTVVYQIVSVVAAVAVIGAGVRYGQSATLLIGAVFAGLFLVTRFVDWWWEWMPKYLFFLIVAALAIGWLWGMRVARRRVEAA